MWDIKSILTIKFLQELKRISNLKKELPNDVVRKIAAQRVGYLPTEKNVRNAQRRTNRQTPQPGGGKSKPKPKKTKSKKSKKTKK